MSLQQLEGLLLKAKSAWDEVPEDLSHYLLVAYSLGSVREKSVNEVIRDYENALTRLVIDTVNSNLSAAEMARSHRSLLRQVDTLAYQEGMREGGIETPQSELTAKDEENVTAWLVQQIRSVPSFAEDCETASKLDGEDARTSARKGLLDRAGLWVDALRGLGMQGYASAQEDKLVTFKLGGTQEHCRTCLKLDGQRHRLSWFADRNLIPQMPGNAHFDCGSWNCECRLVDRSGKSVMI